MACKIFRDKATNEIVEVTAPNGAESKLYNNILTLPQLKGDKELAARYWAQIHTPAFKNWFGDSVLIDENGEPQLFFHGSKDQFDNFNLDTKRYDIHNKGIFFSPNIKAAERYGDIIYPVFLRANTLDESTVNEISGDLTAEQFMEELRAQENKVLDTTDKEGVLFKTHDKEGMNVQQYVVFNPNQVKSVFNRGAFDEANPDIYDTYNTRLEEALTDFLSGLGVEVDLDGDSVLKELYRWESVQEKKALAATDMMHKLIFASKERKYDTLPKHAAYVIYELLGRKSVLHKELWFSIHNWSKYDEVYQSFVNQANQMAETKAGLEELDSVEDTGNLHEDNAKFNSWAHRATIIEFIKQGLVNNFDETRAPEQKRDNEDMNAEYFEKYGIPNYNKVSKFYRPLVKLWAKILVKLKGIFKSLNEKQLHDLILDITDDVYKGSYQKFLRGVRKDGNKVIKPDGTELVLKTYDETLASDSFAAEIIQKFVDNPYIRAKLSGSATTRKYGKTYRPVDESLHDIDLVIPMEVMENQETSTWLEIRKRLATLQEFGADIHSPKFARKELTPLLKETTWYRNVTNLYPSFKTINIFIGKDHKAGESITFTGEITHPTETVLNEDTGKMEKKKYIIDFFVRIDEGNYPEIFDNHWKDWKQIFEAKLKMGRSKDIMDMVFFEPYTPESVKYLFNNKGFRMFDFVNKTEQPLAKPEITDPDQVFEINEDTQKNAIAIDALTKFANKMAEITNVSYELITEEEAIEVTANAENPWNGQAAFFFKDKIFFIKDKLTTDNILHEFIHPVIRAISKDNPALFNKLYDELINTAEGQTLLQETVAEYPTQPANSWIVKEEVLVKGMQKHAQDTMQDGATKQFDSIIQKVLYHIKQFLRKLFGRKINISKLSTNTSLKDLAEMLAEGGKFNIDTTIITEEDIVAYRTETAEFARELGELDNHTLIAISNNQYDLILKHLNELAFNKDYDAIKNILADESGRSDLKEMKINLRKYETVDQVKEGLEAFVDEVKWYRAHTEAMVRNILILDKMVRKIHNHMQELQEEPDSQANVKQMHYYSELLRAWDIWIKDTKIKMNEAGIATDTEVRKLVDSIQSEIDSTNQVMHKVYAEGVSEGLSEVWQPMNTWLTDRHKRLTDKWKKELERKDISERRRTMLQRMIDDEDRTLEENLVDQDKMKKIITGQLGEGGQGFWFNSMLENYTASTDPAIGSFAIWLKNHIANAQTRSQFKYNEFVKDVQPFLEKLGFGDVFSKQYQELTKKMVFIDNIASWNHETGELEAFQAYTFLNEWRDYKYEMAKMYDEEQKAEDEFKTTGTDEAKEAWQNIVDRNERHRKVFFQKEYLEDYYTAQEEILSTEVGREAMRERNKKLEEIRDFQQTVESEFDEFLNSETIDQLWREYRQLFSTYDELGKKKTGNDLLKAELLKKHREDTKHFHEWEEIEGAFQNALERIEDKLVVEGYSRGTQKFKDKLNEWIGKNTRVVVKDAFYSQRAQILKRIKEIFDSLPGQDAKKIKFDEVWKEILDAVSGRRDDDGQPVATEMTQEHIGVIKDLQEAMEAEKANFAGVNGLTTQEMEELSSYYEIIDKSKKLNPAQRKRFNDLLGKKNQLGLSKTQKRELFALFNVLEKMQSKDATGYYLDIADTWHQRLIRPDLEEKHGSAAKEITQEQAEFFLDPKFIDKYKAMDPEFKAWHESNHILKSKYDPDTQTRYDIYERVYVWNIVRPKDPNMYETTTITREDGSKQVIQGVPTMKYFYRRVKDEFRTGYNSKTKEVELIEGVHRDANGKWLPKSHDEMKRLKEERPELFTEEDAAWDRYINHDYLEAKAKNDDFFQLMEVMKKHHRQNQDGLGRKFKLGWEMPRYRKDTYEYLTTGQARQEGVDRVGKLGEFARGIKAQLTRARDDYEEGLNYDEQAAMFKVDMYSSDRTKIPLTGRYKLKHDQVSPDLISGMMAHMLSVEKHKVLTETAPMARALQELVNKQNPADLTKLHKQESLFRKVDNFVPGKKNIRGKTIDAFIETHWEGKNLTGVLSDSALAQKGVGGILKLAAFGFFAFDMTSALKNHFGATFQVALEAAGGRFLTYKDYHAGRFWAFTAMSEISGQIYRKGPKSLKVQMIEIFDPIQGRFEEKFGESITRSAVRDATNFKFPSAHRKWLEQEATLQLFSGMLRSTKVEQTQPDGTVKEIMYRDAWEVRDGQIQLKEGVDPEWGQEGAKFLEFRNKLHEVSNLLQGAYSKMDSSQADRYVLFKMVSFMKKFFTKMFVHRWGMQTGKGKWFKERYNPALMQMHMGFYIRNLNTLGKIMKNGLGYVKYMTKEEVRAFKLQVLEFAKLYAIGLLLTLLGWDDDDPDRIKKLRKRSGALPTPLTDEEWSEGYNTLGWLQNHLILLLMHTEAEAAHFIPLPEYGLNDQIKVFTSTSIATAPTIERYKDIIYHLSYAASGDKRGFYQKDVGALTTQQAEEAKFWLMFQKTVGIKGKTIDPATSIKNFSQARRTSR